MEESPTAATLEKKLCEGKDVKETSEKTLAPRQK